MLTAIHRTRFHSIMPVAGSTRVFLSSTVQYLVATWKAVPPNGSVITPIHSFSRSLVKAPAILKPTSSAMAVMKAAMVLRSSTLTAKMMLAEKRTLGTAKSRTACRWWANWLGPSRTSSMPGHMLPTTKPMLTPSMGRRATKVLPRNLPMR